ncbi:MAG TPA: type II toxin-antitoxin system PemK/MazF family toxin [Tepidisphaeraceae bacterium]|jgi:mRNA-degrading endonuclease toxin of MazEF toxin-antitoxin module
MNAGEIYLANFPFGGSVGFKLRPVLVLSGPIGTVPEVVTAYISSAIPPALIQTDLILDPSTSDHRSTNLKTKSVLRLHKLATLHDRLLQRRLGQLSPAVQQIVNSKLKAMLGL